MKINAKNIVIMFLTVIFSPLLLAGNLDSPAAPTDAGSAMYTIEDIYNRLNDGTTGAKRSGAFVEPTSGPTAGTGHTLDEIMDKAPVIHANGAAPAEVLDGTFFWGLVSGNWGLQVGTATAGANVAGTDGNLVITIPDGLYSGKTATASDADLTAANIKSGATIFGVAGDTNVVDTSSGNASAADIASGKKAWVGGNEVTGEASIPSCTPNSSANPVFTDNNDGTVTDNRTCLIWLKDANCADLAGTDDDGKANWDTANTAASSLANGTCDLTDNSSAGDWHLPTIQELQSLVHYGYNGPAMSNADGNEKWNTGTTGDDAFSGVQSNNYWSSSTDADNTANAWYVNLDNGLVYSRTKSSTSSVWPVRGGV